MGLDDPFEVQLVFFIIEKFFKIELGFLLVSAGILFMEDESISEAGSQIVDAVGIVAIEFGKLFGDDFDG